MLALTCDIAGCKNPAKVWFTDGTAACESHTEGAYLYDQQYLVKVGTTENDFGQPEATLGFVPYYDEHDKFVGVVPRLPMH